MATDKSLPITNEEPSEVPNEPLKVRRFTCPEPLYELIERQAKEEHVKEHYIFLKWMEEGKKKYFPEEYPYAQ